MKRPVTTILSACILLALLLGGSTEASPTKGMLEVFGVVEGDEIEIDDVAYPIKGSATPRVFLGDVAAGVAPFAKELPLGRHVVVIKQPGCLPRAFPVDLRGSLKRSIVVNPANHDTCALVTPPERGV